MFRLFLLICSVFLVPQAQATVLLFDSEVSDYLDGVAEPLLEEAGLGAERIRVRTVLADDVNAFVTPDRRIYFYSGLITKAKTTAEVRGVMAHEIGHIAGQHLALQADRMSQLQGLNLASLLLGVGVIAAGGGDAGTAVLAGGQSAVIANVLQHSRAQERQADQLGVQYLENTGYSAVGLQNFFELLRNQELLYTRRPPAYLSTHPLNPERIDSMRSVVAQESSQSIISLPEEDKQLARVQAKLWAYQSVPGAALRRYPVGYDAATATARSIAYMRLGKHELAMSNLQPLLDKEDSYAQELAGEVMLDAGETVKALVYFEQAAKQRPQAPLLLFSVARALMAHGQPSTALDVLREVEPTLSDWYLYWHLRGVAAGQAGKLGESHTALAESALLVANKADAELHLKLAEPHLDGAVVAVRIRHTQLQQALNDMR